MVLFLMVQVPVTRASETASRSVYSGARDGMQPVNSIAAAATTKAFIAVGPPDNYTPLIECQVCKMQGVTPHNTEQPAVSIRGLTKRYGKLMAVNGLHLDVAPGEILGFLGLNGAGKTTTIRILLDLLRPTSGNASVF